MIAPELNDAILRLATRPDIHSISCPFDDFHLWEGLLKEQVARASKLHVPPQVALCLAGPDSGIHGITSTCFYEDPTENYAAPIVPDSQGNFAPDKWGGEVHIPYEGACEADFFILPYWHTVLPEKLSEPGAQLYHVVLRKCNLLLLKRDLGELNCATRSELAPGWWLYETTAPFMDCSRLRCHQKNKGA